MNDTPREFPFPGDFGLALDPLYAELRREEPVTKIRLPFGSDTWLVTRYEDAMTVMTDPRFSRAATADGDMPRMREDDLGIRANSITGMDAPQHTRLRGLVSKAFTVRRVERLRPRAQQIVDGLLEEMAAAGQAADLVTSLALPLPVTVIAELLDVSTADQMSFREWSDAILSTNAYSPEHVTAAYGQIAGFIAREVARRRTEPGDDLLSALVQARDGEESLTEAELVVFGIVLLVAGYETTANQIANSVYTLLTEPGRAELLRVHPELLPGAVEELLRVVPLGIVSMPVVAAADIELGGVLIRAGEPVMVARASANRDEAVFPRPEEIDFERANNPHMAFGHGAHYCLGAQLARMELQVAIASLLNRFPELRLAVPAEEVPWKTGALVRGVRALLVTW